MQPLAKDLNVRNSACLYWLGTLVYSLSASKLKFKLIQIQVPLPGMLTGSNFSSYKHMYLGNRINTGLLL